MNHFSNKTLNGKWAQETFHIQLLFFGRFMTKLIFVCTDNWYEDKLALE